jgi:hypothetical protein
MPVTASCSSHVLFCDEQMIGLPGDVEALEREGEGDATTSIAS